MAASMHSAPAGKGGRFARRSGRLSHLRRTKRPELGTAWIDLGAIPS